jgi:hypothetical protein
MVAIRPAQLASREIDLEPSVLIGKFAVNDLSGDFYRSRAFNLPWMGKLEQKHSRTTLLERVRDVIRQPGGALWRLKRLCNNLKDYVKSYFAGTVASSLAYLAMIRPM